MIFLTSKICFCINCDGFTQAFASQFVYCRKKLDLDPEKINVNGGAMAIGHPLGATGIYSTLFNLIIFSLFAPF